MLLIPSLGQEDIVKLFYDLLLGTSITNYDS